MHTARWMSCNTAYSHFLARVLTFSCPSMLCLQLNATVQAAHVAEQSELGQANTMLDLLIQTQIQQNLSLALIDSLTDLGTLDLQAALSLTDALSNFLNTAMVLEALGLANSSALSDLGYSQEQAANFTGCLYARAADATYSFQMPYAQPGASGSTSSADSDSGSGGIARHLLPDTASVAASVAVPSTAGSHASSSDLGVDGTLEYWKGYNIWVGDHAVPLTTSMDAAHRQRMVGVGRSNNLMGGILLHQTRRTVAYDPGTYQHCSSTFDKLAFDCRAGAANSTKCA